MASFTLNPPTAYNFRQPEEWRKWLTRFEQFRIASGLSTESGERQVSSLLYCMGVDAEDVLATTNISNDDKKDYSKVVRKFNEYFKVRKNTIFERANFNLTRQLADETMEQFITRLHQIADTCEFGEMRSEMIRDRLVIGIRDQQLSERPGIDTGKGRKTYSPKSSNSAATTVPEGTSGNKTSVREYEQRATSSQS